MKRMRLAAFLMLLLMQTTASVTLNEDYHRISTECSGCRAGEVICMKYPPNDFCNPNDINSRIYLERLRLPEKVTSFYLYRDINAPLRNVTIAPGFLNGSTGLNEIGFEGLNLEKKLPLETFPMDLLHIRMENCHLREFPADFTRFRNLRMLSLEHNNISYFPPLTKESRRAYQNLRDVYIGSNSLIALPPELPGTRILSVRRNRIKVFSTRMMEAEHLDISFNPLEEFSPDAPELVLLDLQKTNLPQIPESIFTFSKLIQIALGPLQDVTVNASQFTFLSSLQYREFEFYRNESCTGTLKSLRNKPWVDFFFESVYLAGDAKVCVLKSSQVSGAHKDPAIDLDADKENSSTTIVWLFVLTPFLVIIVSPWYVRSVRQKVSTTEQEQMIEKFMDEEGDEYDLKSVEFIDANQIILLEIIGSGSFGEVYRASFAGILVAVKKTHITNEDSEAQRQLFREISVLKSLNHPNITQFIGVTSFSDVGICSVCELVERGDMYNVLCHEQDHLSWYLEKSRMAIDSILGLSYLHSFQPPIIHRDFKSKNILIDTDYHAKLTDFGLSRILSSDTMTIAGSNLWLAPEIARGEKYTEKADIYSFGIVLTELDTRQLPYHDARDAAGNALVAIAISHRVVYQNLRPTLDDSCPHIIRDLVFRCTQANPEARPTSMEIATLLKTQFGWNSIEEERLTENYLRGHDIMEETPSEEDL